MKKVNREALLQQLESVQPGLSNREIVEQSSCYVFKEGKVITYNDEIACSQDCDIGVEGAVRSQVFLEILRRLPEEELEVSEVAGEILIKGKRRECGITREAEVTLPVEGVEKPTKFHALPEDFLEAIELVQHCASADESQFVLTCVHIGPHLIEACDNAQLTRVKIETGIKEDILVRRDSVKHITVLGMTEFCETTTWVHFRNPNGLVLSCRRFVDDYHDLSALMDFKGQPITLPKGLQDAADKASIFAQEAQEDAQVKVELRPGKLRIQGQGTSGWYREVKKLAYEGPPLSFMIAPKLLIDITKKYNDAEITDGRLRVRGGKWTYVSCLAPVAEE